MPQSPLERWQPPAQYYGELIARARKHDPKVLAGGASTGEIARMEKLVDRLEKQAAKTADAERRSDPRHIELSVQQRRADAAHGKVVSLQAELKLKAGVSREIAILVTPADLKEPIPITQSASGNSIEENIAVMANLATGHEVTARRLDSILNEWPRLPPEQQNRKLILALAERLKK